MLTQSDLDKLNQLDGSLRKVIVEVSKIIPLKVICTHRGVEEQNKAFAEGKSKVKFPNSKHNKMPSLAVDVVPLINGQIDWNNTKQFAFLAGYILATAKQMNIDVRMGIDFNNNLVIGDDKFLDCPHIELV